MVKVSPRCDLIMLVLQRFCTHFHTPFLFASILWLAGVGLIGCGEPGIERYTVSPAVKPEIETVEQRLLGAIIPNPDRTWFIKLVGPLDQIGMHHQDFDRFVRSVRFGGNTGERIDWNVPDSWHQHDGTGMRFAEFHLGEHEDNPLIVTVTALGSESGSVLANVNRWAGQVGLPPFNEQSITQVIEEVKLEAVTATLVDMRGTAVEGGNQMPPFLNSSQAVPASSRETATEGNFQYHVVPEGWVAQPPRGMRAASFVIRDGEVKAEVTAIPLSGAAGGLVANVNRWRDELGLKKATEQEIQTEVETLEIDGKQASFVEIEGPASQTNSERTLGVIYNRNSRTWFFKMRGESDLVSRNKTAFQEWVQSVHF